MDINVLKHQATSSINWLEIAECLGVLSHAIRNKNTNDIEINIIFVIKQVFSVAREYNIDLDIAWEKWSYKAITKEYLPS